MALDQETKPHRELLSPDPQPPTHAHSSKPRVLQSAEVAHQTLIDNARRAVAQQRAGVELDEGEEFPFIETPYMVLWGHGYDFLEAMTNLGELVNQSYREGYIPVGGITITTFELGSPEAEVCSGIIHILQAMEREPILPTIHFDEVPEDGG